MSFLQFKLYLIGDRQQTIGRTLLQAVREAGEAGVSVVQFREKDLSLRKQFELASEMRDITLQLGMKLLINSRVDLCLALDADGVHLPSTGFPIQVARTMLGVEKLIACSCHNYEDVKKAELEGADFAVLGPIYDTPSKRSYGPPLGLGTFKDVKEKTKIPLFAIGGIGLGCLKEVFEKGADGVAMISAILSAEDVKNQCLLLLEEIERVDQLLEGC